ncbi:uncharacterized protein KNN_03403 [Bacillus thuringiensis serovar tolworthi]|uniref:Uncharacterized protein n=1 Tax=Bacillus thuringiensis subsp. tolworthi TaxID=1442 RepID=A0A9W3ZVT5_BACTO|nr:uncharacterized protein KNN_03403 [Bacillus thuringiensis serovar tolworthi]
MDLQETKLKGVIAHPYQANSFNYPITKFLASLTIDNDRLC